MIRLFWKSVQRHQFKRPAADEGIIGTRHGLSIADLNSLSVIDVGGGVHLKRGAPLEFLMFSPGRAYLERGRKQNLPLCIAIIYVFLT